MAQSRHSFALVPSHPLRGGVGTALPPAAGADPPAALDLGDLGRRMLRDGWIVGLITALTVAAALGYLKVTPKKYESIATLRVEQERKPLLASNDPHGGREDIRSLEALKTIEQGLISQNNLRRVIAGLDLSGDPAFGPGLGEAASIAALASRVKSEVRRGTRLIDVRVEDTNPERARLLAASIAAEFLASTGTEAMAASATAAAALRANATRLAEQIEQGNARLQAYREEHQGLALDRDNNLAAEKVRSLAARLAQTVSERTRLEAAQKEIAALGPAPDVDAVMKVQGAVAGEDVSRLKSDLAQKGAEFARLQKRYGPKHPKYLQAQTEVDALRTRFNQLGSESATSLKAAVSHLAATERGLREQITQAQGEALTIDRVTGPYRLMLSQLQIDQSSFEAVQAQLKVAEVAALAAPTVLSLADAPVTPSRPSKPNRKLVGAMAAVGGGVLGVGVVLLLAMLRPRFDTVGGTERVLRLPALAVIPDARVKGRSLALLDHPNVERECAESFRSLRTALAVLTEGSSARRTLFVAAQAGEGTSFMAANHAISLARQGYRTLLIDANLHHPVLDEAFFAARNGSGLATYLEGRAGTGQGCRPTSVPELFLLSAGEAAANPSELLSGKKLQLLLDDAERWFHRIVIDAPALTSSTDALLMAGQADQIVLVVDARTARPTVTSECARRLGLAGVQPVGFVLNHAARGAAAWQPQEAARFHRPPALCRNV